MNLISPTFANAVRPYMTAADIAAHAKALYVRLAAIKAMDETEAEFVTRYLALFFA